MKRENFSSDIKSHTSTPDLAHLDILSLWAMKTTAVVYEIPGPMEKHLTVHKKVIQTFFVVLGYNILSPAPERSSPAVSPWV